jgi:hypothetical protein
MHNSNVPSNQELPSSGKLIKSTILAAISAGVLLVTVVLPAEYGIDPTGIGKATGLKKMGEIKISLAREVAAENARVQAQTEEEIVDAVEVNKASALDSLSHEMKVTLAPGQGTEIKLAMRKGNRARYIWWTDDGRASFDLHADSEELNIDYHSYSKGLEQKSEGLLEASFDGHHGWYWRNRTPRTMIITLQTDGEYTDIKHFK